MAPLVFKIFTAALCVTTLAAIPAAPIAISIRPPSDLPQVGTVTVDNPNVETEGSGCRNGTVSAAFAIDNAAMTLIFDDFVAGVGPDSGNLRKRAFCRVNLSMKTPGWTFDVSSVDFRTYVNIAKGVEASLVTRWKWIDTTGVDIKGKGTVKKVVSGPFEDEFLLHKDGEMSDNDLSVCAKASATFQLSISVTLSPSGSMLSGIVKGDASDVGFTELLNLSWRKC